MYAWFTAPGRPSIERISTLDDLERFMDGVGFPAEAHHEKSSIGL
jgi:hypothetical protein